TDIGFGIALGGGPTPATDSVTANMFGITKTSSAIDRLGNLGSGSVMVRLDKSAPTITGSRSPSANSNGWNNSDVTVSFTCSDPLSGIKTCPGVSIVSGEGRNESVTRQAVDNADNSASATVGSINID